MLCPALFSRCETIEIQVRVRKRSMAGKSEIRKLFVRGDTIELVNPEKRMFRSQSKMFPLSDLTAVCSTSRVHVLRSLMSLRLEIVVRGRGCGGIVLSPMECHEETHSMILSKFIALEYCFKVLYRVLDVMCMKQIA